MVLARLRRGYLLYFAVYLRKEKEGDGIGGFPSLTLNRQSAHFLIFFLLCRDKLYFFSVGNPEPNNCLAEPRFIFGYIKWHPSYQH